MSLAGPRARTDGGGNCGVYTMFVEGRQKGRISLTLSNVNLNLPAES